MEKMRMLAKNVWKSRTIILNILVGIATVLLDNAGILAELGISDGSQVAFIAGMNIFLRVITKTKVILSLPYFDVVKKDDVDRE
jgi:hypothetical protein